MSWFCYFSKCIQQNASQHRRLWYFMIPCQCACVCACFFFYIKFYVSSSLSYCWAIRPPLSFSFFLCPFSLHSPFSAPTLVLSLFLPVSLTLPYLSFFLSDFLLLHFLFHCLPSHLLSVWLSLSHTVSPSVFLSLSSVFCLSSFWRYSLLMAQELFSFYLSWSQFPSQAGHTLLALVTDCLQLRETSILNDSRQEAFVWDGDGERQRKIEGLCNHSAAQLTCSLTCFLLR